MQNATAPRSIFRKEAILRHIQREDSTVLPTSERCGELYGLWLSVATLLFGCIASAAIPSKCTISAIVLESAEASGLCVAVPVSAGDLLHAATPVQVSWNQLPDPLPATSAGAGCSMSMNHDTGQLGKGVALRLFIPPAFHDRVATLKPGMGVELTAHIRVRDLVRNGLISKRGDRE